MVIIEKIIAIGVIMVSIAIGLISFYLFSDHSKDEKKKYLEALTSQLINFIIFIWVGKILLNLSLFIEDPLAVLAYPGDSGAFYLAVLFTSLNIIYHSIRKKLDLLTFSETFAHVFLIGLFFYEFYQMIFEDNTYSFGSMIILFILLTGSLLLRGRINPTYLLIIILAGWSIGYLILSLILPFVSVFGYLIETWFIVVFFIFGTSILLFNERKEKL